MAPLSSNRITVSNSKVINLVKHDDAAPFRLGILGEIEIPPLMNKMLKKT